MKYTLTNESVTIVTPDGPVTVRKGQPNFFQLRAAVLEEDEEKAMGLLTVEDSIEEWSSGLFKVKNEAIHYGDEQLPGEFNSRILEMLKKGESPEPILNFWEKLQNNPSWHSVKQLFRFLSNKGIPIQEDGTFLAYKSVRQDLTDVHSGKFKNEPGAVIQMARNKISDDPNQPCHEGFHIGSLEYARGFGGTGNKLLICQVDPADVVCVPYDSSSGKMRVCEYLVVGFYSGQALPSTTIKDAKPKEAKAPRKTKKKIAKTQTVENKTDWGPLTPKGIKNLNDMGLLDLATMHIVTLRRYAGHLKVVGAWKLPGGKTSLMEAIGIVRKGKA